MNKKIIFYFLTALVVLIFKTDSSYSTPIISDYKKNLDFWTPEKLKKAKANPLTTRKIGFRTRSDDAKTTITRNTTDSSKYTKSMPSLERKYDIINNKPINVENADQIIAFPIGILFIPIDNDGAFQCNPY